jgi:phosphoglycolate phosphatase-like HAD superfamily hydrolase
VPSSPRPLARVRAIVWDMDGTLLDSAFAVPHAYATAVRDLGGPALTRDEVIAAYPLGPVHVLLAHFLGRPATGADVAVYLGRLRDAADHVSPYSGIPSLLQTAGRRSPCAVFTGASRAAAAMLLEASRLLPLLTTLVGGDEVTHPKPAPDGIVEACRRLGVEPGHAAYVGDSPLDMEAARRSGALAVAAGWGHQYEKSAPADVVFASPADLEAALS